MKVSVSEEEYVKILNGEQLFVIVYRNLTVRAFTSGLNGNLELISAKQKEPIAVKSSTVLSAPSVARYLDGGLHTMRMQTARVIQSMSVNGVERDIFLKKKYDVIGIELLNKETVTNA